MIHRSIPALLAVAALALLPAACRNDAAPAAPSSASPAAAHDHATHDHAAHGDQTAAPSGEAAASYTCPMHPEVKQSTPGRCPKCGMDLVPAEKK